MSKLIEAYENLIAIQSEEITALKELVAVLKDEAKALRDLIRNQETQLYILKNGKSPPPVN